MTPLQAELVALRRALHRVPELSFAEHETHKLIRSVVEAYGPVTPVARTGFYTDLGDLNAPLTMLLRADMDGLPIQEETELPFASTRHGHMHACGHDAHMAALAVAGRLLSQAPPHGVRLRLLFQPAEEGGGGALACINEGVLDGVDVAFGIHVWNELPIGSLALTAGGIMAGVVEFNVVVNGRGGHGAMPHRTADPIVAASQLVGALQTISSRFSSPLEPVVVSVGAIHAGSAFNVIPETCRLSGTVRTFSLSEQESVEAHVRAICRGIGAATDTQIDVEWIIHSIPTVNNEVISDLCRQAVDRMVGIERILDDYRTMAGEDFGEILAEVPGCFALLGSGNAEKGLSESHHSPRFEIDEDVLTLACNLHRSVAAEFAEHGEMLFEQ